MIVRIYFWYPFVNFDRFIGEKCIPIMFKISQVFGALTGSRGSLGRWPMDASASQKLCSMNWNKIGESSEMIVLNDSLYLLII